MITKYGPGDEQTWGAITHPNDPRQPDDGADREQALREVIIDYVNDDPTDLYDAMDPDHLRDLWMAWTSGNDAHTLAACKALLESTENAMDVYTGDIEDKIKSWREM